MIRKALLFCLILLACSGLVIASQANDTSILDRKASAHLAWEEESIAYDVGCIEIDGEPGIDQFFVFSNPYGLSVQISVIITDTDIPGAILLAPTAPVPSGKKVEITLLHELLAPGTYHVCYLFFISTFWWEQSLRGRGTVHVTEGEL